MALMTKIDNKKTELIGISTINSGSSYRDLPGFENLAGLVYRSRWSLLSAFCVVGKPNGAQSFHVGQYPTLGRVTVQ